MSIATTENELRQGSKSILRNFIIDECKSVENTPPKNARLIYDALAIMRTLKPCETYESWFLKLYNIRIQNTKNPISIELINDKYVKDSIKSSTRIKRGEECKRVHLTSDKQKMLKGKDWNIFFNNILNKQRYSQFH